MESAEPSARRLNAATGDAAELDAAAHFRRAGYIVAAPWGAAPYDLVIDNGSTLERVEVKSTTQRGWVKRNCKVWGWTIVVDASKPFDWLYCHTPDVHYLIPKYELGGRRKGVTVPRSEDYPTESRWARFALNVSATSQQQMNHFSGE